MGTNYQHLSCEERTMIQLGLEQGCTLRAIARSVQRAPSSISRELNRNGWNNPATAPKKRGRPPVAGGYRAPISQQRASALARTARCPSRLAQDGPLWGHVERLLRACHSPEQIAGILQRMHPDQPNLQEMCIRDRVEPVPINQRRCGLSRIKGDRTGSNVQ